MYFCNDRVCVCDSVLMADVMGLTALSQDCSAAEMVRMLNELFGRFDQLAAVQCTVLLSDVALNSHYTSCTVSFRLSCCQAVGTCNL